VEIHGFEGDSEQCSGDRCANTAAPVVNVHDIADLALAPFTTRDPQLAKPDRHSLLLGDPDETFRWLMAPLANRLSDEGLGFGGSVGSPCLVSARFKGRSPLVDSGPVVEVDRAQCDIRHPVIRLALRH
jgi:hypothetical protein